MCHCPCMTPLLMRSSLIEVDGSMSENREEILESFMVVTRIKNVEEAIIWLECCDWDISRAIKYSSPEEAKIQKDAFCKNKGNASLHVLENVVPNEGADPLQNGEQELRVIQVYVVYGSSIHMVRAPDNITIQCFKRLISFATNVPPCQQVITGWNQEPTSDTEKLSFMPNLSYVILKDPSSPSVEDHVLNKMELGDEVMKIYDFKIFDELHDRIYTVKVPGNFTVAQVKKDASALTDIPITCQEWSGWPEGTTDFTEVRFLVLNTPCHSLGIRLIKSAPEVSTSFITAAAEPSEDVINIDDSSDIFVGENYNSAENMSNTNRPQLIPETVEDEMAGSVHFVDEYTNRYGEATPFFFTGTLEDAVREAFRRPARERRMLAIYLHHDDSVLSNVFCTELLGSEATQQILSSNFLLWGWDMTNGRSQEILKSSVSRILGNFFSMTLENIPIESFPALFIIAPTRGTYELLNVAYGNNGVSELLAILVNSLEIFSRHIEVEAMEEDERAARQKIKFEQDTAYEESLNKDREKDEAKKQKLIEQILEEERNRKCLKEEEDRRQAEVAVVEAELPAEPSEHKSLSHVFTFRFKAPNGEIFGRRFEETDTLDVLFNYLFVKGFDVKEYKLIAGWPRKDLTLIPRDTPLQDLGVFYQETMMLEAR